MKSLVCLILIAVPSICFAVDEVQWFERQAEGWFWYIDPPPEEEQAEVTEKNPVEVTPIPLPILADPKAKLKEFQEKLENAQALAIMQPTPQNVSAYLYLQKEAMDRSQRFSEVWQQVVWTTPTLDHTLVRPTSPKAVHAYYDERNDHRKQNLKRLSQTHGLFYFFRESCPYCQQFSPILKSFAKRHGFHVTAISMDGGPTPGFDDYRMDNGTASRLGVQTVPAVYLVEPKSRHVQPVSFGLLGPTELEERIESIMNTPRGLPSEGDT